jgi:hypothetical protein
VETITKAPVDVGSPTNTAIENRRIAGGLAKDAENAAAIVASAEVEAAEKSAAELAKIDAQIAEASADKTRLEECRRTVRRKRGELLAADVGASTTTEEKNLVAIDRDVQRIEDKLEILREQRLAAERNVLIANWHSIVARRDAFDGCLAKANHDAALLKVQWEIALLTRDAIKVRADAYHAAHDRAYGAILDHKTKHPALYPED